MQNTILERLRSEHHKAAKLIAAGCSIFEVATSTRRSEKNIADLQCDPAFVGLVQFYREKDDEN